jgi:hypothetical protein
LPKKNSENSEWENFLKNDSCHKEFSVLIYNGIDKKLLPKLKNVEKRIGSLLEYGKIKISERSSISEAYQHEL